MDIYKIIPHDEYEAILEANNPSDVNVFATMADLTVTGAANGLTVVSSNVELGGTLTKNTEIDAASFGYNLRNSLSGDTNGASTLDIDGFYYGDDTKGNDVIRIGYDTTLAKNQSISGALLPVTAVSIAGQGVRMYGSRGVIGEYGFLDIKSDSVNSRVLTSLLDNFIAVNTTQVVMEFNDLTNKKALDIGGSGAMTVTDSIDSTGLVYAVDYSSNGTADDRWIPDYGAVKAFVEGGFTLDDAANIVVNSTTGTKIATSTSQKLGFFDATPVAQQSAFSAAKTTMTVTAPLVEDFVMQDATNSSPWGFADGEELRTFMVCVVNLQQRVAELETGQENLGFHA